MAELTVYTTYGTALFEAAKDLNLKSQISQEAHLLVEIFHDEPDLFRLLTFPAVSVTEKKDVLEKIFSGKICEPLLNFLYVLVDKRRVGSFEGIIKVFNRLVDKEDGVSYGSVYSVEKLSDEHLRSIEEDISKLLKINVKLENQIDPKLIGGVKVMVDGKLIDASIRKKFDDLGSQIIGGGLR